MVATPEELYARAEMIVKVKEPQPAERPLLRRGQIVFAYFHLAADRQLDRGRCSSRARLPWPTRRSATTTAGCRC